MAKCFKNEQRTFDKRIRVNEEIIVPDLFALEGGEMNDESPDN